MSARFVSTTQLSNVVQMIALAHQSGILRAMRGHGTARELGQIRFMDGQPVAALLGQLTGQAALTVLMNWGECIYTFDEGPQLESLDSDPTRSVGGASSPSMGSTSPLGGGSAESWPSYGYGLSGSSPSYTGSPYPPLSPPPGISGATPSVMSPFGSLPHEGAALPTAGAPPAATRGAGGAPSGAQNPARSPASGSAVATTPDLHAITPEVLQSVPARTPVSTQVEQLPLDRRERMVLLLVDGQRTVADLTRLIRRNQQEVYAVLHHLRLLGLIEFRK